MASGLVQWPHPEIFQGYGFFWTPKGFFIGDGSYLFVPDTPLTKARW